VLAVGEFFDLPHPAQALQPQAAPLGLDFA
jgi:hypothetical protein